MSARRLFRVLRFDLSWHLRRPLVWIWIGVLVLLAWGLTTGNVTLQSGGAGVGGEEAWITSQFAVAQTVAFTVLVLYAFFLAITAGMAVIQEDEWGVGPLLHATPLRPAEYVWGKAGALLALFGLVLVAHLAATVFFNHAIPHPENPEIFGPFAAASYLVPAVVFGLPPILFLGGVSFLLGERTRRPVLVYLFPIALVALTIFLWRWSPAWMDPATERVLMLTDVTGFRWLRETWLEVDRGVEFYNTAPIGFDADFLASRVVFCALGLGAIARSARGYVADVRGVAGREVLGEGSDGTGETGETPGEASSGPLPAATGTAASGARPLSETPTTGQGAPGFVRSTARVAVSELRELASSPGLYLFVPLIVLQLVTSAQTVLGPFDTRTILTPGLAAVEGYDTLLLLTTLLLLFYTVETLERDEATGLAPLSRTSAVPTGAFFAGKVLAMMALAGAILAAAVAGAGAGIAIQGEAAFAPGPFLWVWGAVMGPTLLLWIVFLAAVHAATGSRYATYGVGLGILTLILYHALSGGLEWATDWMLWDSLVWTDMGFFPLDREPLFVNRLLALSTTALLFLLAVRWYRRRTPDPVALASRLRPGRLLRRALATAPLALVPVGLGVWLWLGAERGFQGPASDRAAEDYWKQNFATYRDHPVPDLDHMELDLELWPEERRMASRGELTLVNRRDTVLDRVPLTAGFHWENVRWKMNGDGATPENRSGLHVFRPDGGLGPGESVRIGWRFVGRYPDGWTEVGGRGVGTFVLPAGVVLHTLAPIVAPVPGYMEGIGRTEERDHEPAERPEGWWRGPTEPGTGVRVPFTARVEITGPAGWRFHSVGVLAADSLLGERRTMTWETDYPVRLLNVVGGRWEVAADTTVLADGDTARTAVYHHPAHDHRIDEIAGALAAARKHYAAWFTPFPWRELRLNEFPNLRSYAQGFPTNITFSEGIGFLAQGGGEVDAAFMITAHEAAHQWWGNLLTPGEGPGGNVLSEGLAHFSAALLLEEEKGPEARRAFLRRIEDSYAEGRRADAERPLVETDGSRPGDQTVVYDRGGWAFWMLMDHMGRERTLRGFRGFVERYRHGPDYPVLHDFLAHMESFASDTAAYRGVADRWFRKVVVPEYRILAAEARPDGAGGWITEVTVENVGTGRPPVEVAAVRGELGEGDAAEATVCVGGGETRTVTVRSEFRPERAVVDPDVRVLMLERDAARRELEGSGVPEGDPASGSSP